MEFIITINIPNENLSMKEVREIFEKAGKSAAQDCNLNGAMSVDETRYINDDTTSAEVGELSIMRIE